MHWKLQGLEIVKRKRCEQDGAVPTPSAQNVDTVLGYLRANE